MDKRDLFDWYVFAGTLLYGFVGASAFLFYHTLVPVYPPWDLVLWEYPLVTLTDSVALLVPASTWFLVYIIAVSRYLGLRDMDR